MRIRPHAPISFRCQFGQFRFQATLFVEELIGSIAIQPILDQRKMPGMSTRVGDGHLMRAESALNLLAIDHFWPCPALG